MVQTTREMCNQEIIIVIFDPFPHQAAKRGGLLKIKSWWLMVSLNILFLISLTAHPKNIGLRHQEIDG